MKGHSPLMSSRYTKHSRAPQEMLPHFCSWSCNVSVPPYFWGGCERCCHMLCRKAWDEEWEAESCEKLPLLRSLGSSKARGKAAVPRHWWDAETVPAFWQGKLCDKGKGWIPPGFTFFPVLPSIVFIMYISSLIHHLLAPSHLCVSAWAWQPQVFFLFHRAPQEPARRERGLSAALFNDWGVCSISDMTALVWCSPNYRKAKIPPCSSGNKLMCWSFPSQK